VAERLDRERVVKAALALLDEVGLDGLTLRRLATELGVQAPALYWHFKNKQELLDQMADAIIPPAEPPAPGEGWDSWLAGRARAGREALNRHRDGARLAASTRPEPSQWQNIEMQIGVLVDAGLTAAQALSALMAIGNYIAGFTLEEQADRMRGQEPDPQHWAQALADYPLILEAVRTVGDPQGDASFEAGLGFIIDGIRERITPTR
jgi:TetR/AcrR family tetracycline transcriptional repressor